MQKSTNRGKVTNSGHAGPQLPAESICLAYRETIPPPPEPPGRGNRPAGGEEPGWGQFAGYGLQIAVGVGLGALVGYWLDNKFNWSPFGLLVGALLGLAGGMYLLIKDVIRMNKD